MKPLSSDTSPEAEAVRFELIRGMPTWKRFQLTCELIQSARRSMISDIRRRNPTASENEIRRRFISRVLQREEVIAAYGFDPVSEGYSK
jgi:hypothetical protein